MVVKKQSDNNENSISNEENLDELEEENNEKEKDGSIEEDIHLECKIKIEKLEEDIKNLNDVNLRLKAEFDNFKKRTRKEKISTYNMAKSDCMTPFLDVLDNLERAVSLVEKKDRFSEGIDLVINKFYEVLKNAGIVEIECVGKTFDPNFHEAVKVVEDENYEKNTICEVIRKGFMLSDSVVRHALVVVANP